MILDISTFVRVSGEYGDAPGGEIEVRAAQMIFLRVEEGKVIHHVDHVDYAEAMRQIEAERTKRQAGPRPESPRAPPLRSG